MKVTLDIAGGLAPPLMSRQHVVDTDGLEEAQQRALAELIDAALKEPQPAPKQAARDARSYEIRVGAGPGEKTIVAYDGSIRPTTRKLIEMIKSLAQS